MYEIGVRIQEKGQVTIPRHIRAKLKLKPGDLVVFIETKSGVMVKPAALIHEDERSAEMNAIVNSIRERFKEYSVEEIDSVVRNAVKATRRKRP